MKILHLLSFLRRRAAAVRASYIFLLPVLFSQSLDAIVISPEASLSTYSTCVHMYASTRRPKMRPSVLSLSLRAGFLHVACDRHENVY
jgi:hypothetical protein